MEVLLVGEALSVQRASEIGFVNKILPVGQPQGALDYAHRIVANAPLVVQLLKRFVDRTIPKGPSEMAGLARREIHAVTASADAAEGLTAFRGKRPPTLKERTRVFRRGLKSKLRPIASRYRRDETET